MKNARRPIAKERARRAMADSGRGQVTVGSRGRIVIPAELRRQLQLEDGEHLRVRGEDGRLIFETGRSGSGKRRTP